MPIQLKTAQRPIGLKKPVSTADAMDAIDAAAAAALKPADGAVDFDCIGSAAVARFPQRPLQG